MPLIADSTRFIVPIQTPTLLGSGALVGTTYYSANGLYVTSTATTVTTPTWFVPNSASQLYAISSSTSLVWHVADVEISPDVQKAQAKQDRRKTLRARSSIKRALKLISNFGMEEDVRIFMRGQTIEVSHPESQFKFVLSRSCGILDRTIYAGLSTPYKLQLFTKSDVHISDLCVYMTDTPVLDQVLALAMYVKTGNEDDVLRTANFFNLNRELPKLDMFDELPAFIRNKLSSKLPYYVPHDGLTLTA